MKPITAEEAMRLRMSKPVELPPYFHDKTNAVKVKLLREIVNRQHQQLRYWQLEKDGRSQGQYEF